MGQALLHVSSTPTQGYIPKATAYMMSIRFRRMSQLIACSIDSHMECCSSTWSSGVSRAQDNWSGAWRAYPVQRSSRRRRMRIFNLSLADVFVVVGFALLRPQLCLQNGGHAATSVITT